MRVNDTCDGTEDQAVGPPRDPDGGIIFPGDFDPCGKY